MHNGVESSGVAQIPKLNKASLSDIESIDSADEATPRETPKEKKATPRVTFSKVNEEYSIEDYDDEYDEEEDYGSEDDDYYGEESGTMNTY